MKTLHQHNLLTMQRYEKVVKTIANGLACPNCGNELHDSDPRNIPTTAFPTGVQVHCPACGYMGKRLL
jgi:predicted RNA-binding Zn-ribbon protein involved in translation (DUF1610 family)